MKTRPILVACPQCHELMEVMAEVEQVTLNHYEREVTVKFADWLITGHECKPPTAAGRPGTVIGAIHERQQR
jgi:hypothetical protein